MEWNEDLENTSIDDIFSFTGQVQGGKKKKRSSILKQSKYVNSDFFENEETITDNRRKSQRMKRVSFAETFQVKELHTGNIYDIPGGNESNTSKGSHSVESEKDGLEGNSTSRSLIPDSASILETSGLNPLKNKNTEDYTAMYKNDECEFEPQYPPFVSLEKSSTGIQLEKEMQAPYFTNKTVRELLEDDMEMSMIHSTDNWNIASESYSKKTLEEKNYTIKTVISQSVHTWKADKGVPDKVSSFNDLFGVSPFKSGSQEYESNKENMYRLPSASGPEDSSPKIKYSLFTNTNEINISSSSIPFGGEVTVKSFKQPQEKIDSSNKENIFQVSPKFQNLKFIDSPPTWKSSSENFLKSFPAIDLESCKKSADNDPPNQISSLKKNTKEASVQNHRKGLGLHQDTVEDRIFNHDCLPQSVDPMPQVHKSLPFGENCSTLNKTLHNVVSMDLTLLPEGLSEDSDVSCIQEQDGSVDLKLYQKEAEHNFSRHPGNSSKVSEKTVNKTRLSICDMEMTCLNPLDNSSLCLSPPKENVLDRDNVIMRNASEQDVDLKIEWPTSENAFLNNDIKAAGDFREKIYNKTGFSTCDMDITCMVSDPTGDDSFSMCLPKSVEGMPGNCKGEDEELSFHVSTSKENFMQSKCGISEVASFVTKSSSERGKVNLPFNLNFSSDEELSPVSNPFSKLGSAVGKKQVHTNITKENFKHSEGCVSGPSFVTELPLEVGLVNSPFNLNFSSDDELTPVSNPVLQPGSDVGKKQVYTSISFLKDTGDTSEMENMFNDSNVQHNSKVEKNSYVIENHNLKQDKQNVDVCEAACMTSGRKYLKVSSVPERVDRIQTHPPDEETISDSYIVNNKENLHSNRKRNMLSGYKSTKLPLGEKEDAEEDVLKPSVFGKSLSSVDCHPNLGIISLKENALCKKVIPPWEDPSLPETAADSNMSYLLQSEAMNVSGRDVCLNGNVNVSSPIAKEVHILTKTNISKDNVFISSSKYEKIKYSMSDGMDLSFVSQSEKLPSTFDEIAAKAHSSTSGTEPVSNLKIQSEYDINSPIKSNVFRHINSELLSLNDSHSGKYSQMSIYGNKTLHQDGKCTQHFTSQAMDLTCMKSNLQDCSLRVTQAEYDKSLREHPAPPYFQLQEVPLAVSPDQKNMSNNMNQRAGMGHKLFALCTDNFSFSNASSKTPGTRKRALSFDSSRNNSHDLLSTVLEETSFKGKSIHDVLGLDSSLRVGTDNLPRSVDVEKHCVKSQKVDSSAEVSVIRKQSQPPTPGVVYNIRRIRQSLKGGGNNIILFPELSQCIKKQKFNFKHPYTDMKITSPVHKMGKLSRSFDGCSRETSFTCLPRESSVCPPIEPLPSLSLKTMDLSQRMSLLNPTAALHGSLSVSKVDTIPNGEQPSDMEESLQLLPGSVLESSLLDGTSKNFTIGLDRSDFVAKDPGSSGPPEQCSLLAVDSVNRSVLDEIAQIPSDSVFCGNAPLSASGEINTTAAVGNETALARNVPSISPENNKSTKITSNEDYNTEKAVPLTVLPSQSSEQKTHSSNSSFGARTLGNDLLFQFAPLRSDNLEGTPSSNRKGNTPSKIPKLKSQMRECVKIHISQESKSPAKADNVYPFTCKPSTSSKAVESFDIHEDNNDTSIPQEVVDRGEVSFVEKQDDLVHNKTSSVHTLNEAQKLEITISPNDLPKKLEGAFLPPNLVQQTSRKEALPENEEALKNQVKKFENCESNNGGNSSVRGDTISLDLNSWKEKFEKASSGSRPSQQSNHFDKPNQEGMKWRMKSLQKDCAVFEIFWKVHVFQCVVQVDVKHIGPSQSSISFVPILQKNRKKVVECVVDDIKERAYSYFQYLATDTVLPFTIFSEDMINKLAEYSKIAKDVSTLMLDLLKLAVVGLGDTVSYELDPLKVYFRVVNENYECVFDMTFQIDLKKYPRERIVPQLKHVLQQDITKVVENAVSCIEPGKDYLYRMVDVCLDLKP